MALTKSQATAIVDVVAADPISILRIEKSSADPLTARMVPESLGISGAMRNWGFVAIGADSSDPAVAMFVCTGIAEATSTAIEQAKAAKPGSLPGVKSAGQVSRVGTLGTDHTATLITMDDGSEYVFDWHATLNPRNPMISKKSDWMRSSGGTTYFHFAGYAL